jgi:hypothetical protein
MTTFILLSRPRVIINDLVIRVSTTRQKIKTANLPNVAS